MVYVVDARQSLHFRMVFDTARRAGWLGDDVRVVQLAFGTVLGKDGKPFKTREGETVRARRISSTRQLSAPRRWCASVPTS